MKAIKLNTLSISNWSEQDQPRNKVINKGMETLTDSELLSLIIGSGSRTENAVELSRHLLSSVDNNLNAFSKLDLNELLSFEGLGTAKAIAILSAIELGRRRQASEPEKHDKITCSRDLYNLMQPILADKPIEEFWVAYLSNSGSILKKMKVSTGGIDGTYCDIRIILREALFCRATQIAVFHNHPSGNPRPSGQDNRLTCNLREAAKTMNIRMLDHVIICSGKYYSYADEGAF